LTISSTTRIAGPFVGTGSASVFPFTFKVFAASDLDVIRLNSSTGVETTLVLTTDYTVTLNGNQNTNPGGSVTLVAGALASGFTLTITSDISNLQPTDLTNQGGFYPEVITDSLDRATIQIQQMSEDIGRSLKGPISDGSLNMELQTASIRANKYLVFDANGLPITSAGSGADTALRTDLANTGVTTAGAGLVGFRNADASSVARTVLSKLRDAVSVKDFGAAGDGATDDTAEIQAALDAVPAVGGCVYFPAGTYVVSAPLVVDSNTVLVGDGMYVSNLSATTAFTSSQAMVYANAENNITIEDLGFFGNTNGTLGAGTGIHLKNGTRNQVRSCYVENTTQAGIRYEEQNNGIIDGCTLNACGRTGYTDNHGIMLYSASGSAIQTYSCKVTSNTVTNAFRKGITTFSELLLYDLLISGNTVTGSGLGNIYVGGTAPTSTHDKIRVVGNYVEGGPINIQIGSTSNSVIDGNTCGANTTASANIGFVDSTDLVISNNVVQSSDQAGISALASGASRNEQISIVGNILRNNNRSNSATGFGIHVFDTDVAIVSGNIVIDDVATTRQRYGIVDATGNTNVAIRDNVVLNVVTAPYLVQTATGMLSFAEFGTSFVFEGSIRTKQATFTAANGNNNNIAIPSQSGTVRITGPTGAYSITGLAGGSVGREITIINDTAQTLTLEVNDVNSSVGNRLLPTGSVDMTVVAYGSARLLYATAQGNNFWVTP
jgi:parallel beta-helix repeat protein